MIEFLISNNDYNDIHIRCKQTFSRNGKSFIHNKYSFSSRKKLVININLYNAIIINHISSVVEKYNVIIIL